MTAFIDFGPRIADIPDALMARIMACRPIVSLNRQEAQIAAERFGVEPENLGAQWQQRFGAALIVRHDKDGAPGMTVTLRRCSGVSGHGGRYHWRSDSHAGGTLAGLGWSLADAVLLGNAVPPGWSATAAVIAPTREELLLAHKDV
jgi:hypothetical protein